MVLALGADELAVGPRASFSPGRNQIARFRLRPDWCRVKELHPQPSRSERDASAGWANAAKVALPAGLSPATSAFEARRSIH